MQRKKSGWINVNSGYSKGVRLLERDFHFYFTLWSYLYYFCYLKKTLTYYINNPKLKIGLLAYFSKWVWFSDWKNYFLFSKVNFTNMACIYLWAFGKKLFSFNCLPSSEFHYFIISFHYFIVSRALYMPNFSRDRLCSWHSAGDY